MTLQLQPLHAVFVAKATSIGLTRPLAEADVRAINAAMNEHAVLVWRGQPLTPQQQIDLTKSFGPLHIGRKRILKRPERLPDERLIDISNVDAQGQMASRDSKWPRAIHPRACPTSPTSAGTATAPS
ncbi:MAG: TauD/TfdA dioxygenase family protein [Aquincola tertiaricarbonis]